MKEHLNDHKSKCFPMVLGDLEFMIPTPYIACWGFVMQHASWPSHSHSHGHQA